MLAVLVSACGGSGSSAASATVKHPKTLADLPAQKGAVHAPYVVGTTLYADGKTFTLAGPVTAVAPVEQGVIVELNDGSSDGRDEIDEVSLKTGVQTALTKGASSLISDGKTYAAWRAPGTATTPTDVVVHEIKEGDVDTDVPPAGQCCDSPVTLLGITPNGQLIAGMTTLRRYWVWQFRDSDDGELTDSETPVELSALKGQAVSRVIGDKIVVVGVGAASPSATVATIGGDGTVSAPASWVAAEPQAVLSASGEQYASSLAGTVSAAKLGDAEDPPVRLWLPVGIRVQSAVPDDATHDVLVVSSAKPDGSTNGAVVRCDFETGACTFIRAVPPSAD